MVVSDHYIDTFFLVGARYDPDLFVKLEMVILFEIHQVETGNISAVRDQHKCLERNKVRVELEVGSDFSSLDLGHVALYSFDLFASINCVCGVQCVLNFEYFPSRLHRHKFAPASVDFINHVYDLLDFTW